jgi:hypothetical protein
VSHSNDLIIIAGEVLSVAVAFFGADELLEDSLAES